MSRRPTRRIAARPIKRRKKIVANTSDPYGFGFDPFKAGIIEHIPIKPVERKVKQEDLFESDGFRFYLEIVITSPFNDPFSSPPHEYYVEEIATKNRVALPIALKIGEIEGVDIPVRMFDWIHEYDESLD